MNLRAPYRTLTVLVLAACLMAPFFYSVHCYVNLLRHRAAMWAKAETRLLQSIEVDSASIHWVHKNREMMVNGHYFDVESVKYRNGRALVKGIFDHEEEKLRDAFAAARQNEPASGNAARKIAGWLQWQWAWAKPESPAVPVILLVQSYPPDFSSFLFKQSVQPPAPPPWPV